MSPETSNTQSSHELPRTQNRRELIKDVGMFAARTVVLGAVLGTVVVEGKRKTDLRNETQAYEEDIEKTLVYIDDLCDNPSTIPWVPEDISEQVEMYSEVGFSEYYAEKAGLNLLATEEALFATEHAQSVDELIDAFDVLTRQFGATTTIAENWRFPEGTPQGYAEGQSELGMLKHRFRRMIEQLRHVPKELFESSGVTNIHFTEFTSSSIKAASGAETVTHGRAWLDGEGRMAISLDNVYAGQANEFTVLHEIGHLLDESLLGGGSQARNDTHFADLNEPGFEYFGIIPDGVEADGFVTDYSAVNVLEDKAVIFENMLSGVDFNLAQSQDPIVRKKYRLQLARLEYRIPNIAPYLMLHGYHGGISPRNPYGARNSNSTVAVV